MKTLKHFQVSDSGGAGVKLAQQRHQARGSLQDSASQDQTQLRQPHVYLLLLHLWWPRVSMNIARPRISLAAADAEEEHPRHVTTKGTTHSQTLKRATLRVCMVCTLTCLMRPQSAFACACEHDPCEHVTTVHLPRLEASVHQACV